LSVISLLRSKVCRHDVLDFCANQLFASLEFWVLIPFSWLYLATPALRPHLGVVFFVAAVLGIFCHFPLLVFSRRAPSYRWELSVPAANLTCRPRGPLAPSFMNICSLLLFAGVRARVWVGCGGVGLVWVQAGVTQVYCFVGVGGVGF